MHRGKFVLLRGNLMEDLDDLSYFSVILLGLKLLEQLG